uniref:Uncharacterized protein n=1 Tax=Chaetoceros debilis TaxID=122233 RepID=A0A7S3PUW8_9STRA
MVYCFPVLDDGAYLSFSVSFSAAFTSLPIPISFLTVALVRLDHLGERSLDKFLSTQYNKQQPRRRIIPFLLSSPPIPVAPRRAAVRLPDAHSMTAYYSS